MLHHKVIRAGRASSASLAFAALALLIFLIPGASSYAQLNRETLHGFQIWKLFSSHFAHWSFDHLLWDLITFLALGIYCEKTSRKSLLATLGISATIVSLTFLLYETDLTYYRGLSGIDSALFGLALTQISTLSITGKQISLIATTGFLAKLTYELITQTPIFVSTSDTTFVVLPSAHLTGFITGLSVGLYSIRPNCQPEASADAPLPRDYRRKHDR